jgi:hypothetical protein
MYIFIGEDLRVVAEEKHQCQIKELKSTFSKEKEDLSQMTENLRIAGEENKEKYQCHMKESEYTLHQVHIYI